MDKQRTGNKLVGKEYVNFINTMSSAAEFDELPIMLEIAHPSSIVLEDYKELAEWVKEDTGLAVDLHACICPDCGKLHAYVRVDYEESSDDCCEI